jgi:hypothetical protein
VSPSKRLKKRDQVGFFLVRKADVEALVIELDGTRYDFPVVNTVVSRMAFSFRVYNGERAWPR